MAYSGMLRVSVGFSVQTTVCFVVEDFLRWHHSYCVAFVVIIKYKSFLRLDVLFLYVVKYECMSAHFAVYF